MDEDIAIINIDNPYCNRIFEELSKNKQGPKIIPISIKKKLNNGIYYSNGVLYDSINFNDYKIGKVENFTSLIGNHNKENIVCPHNGHTNLIVTGSSYIINFTLTVPTINHILTRIYFSHSNVESGSSAM